MTKKTAATAKALRIEIYHKRLRGGRLNISADTTSERVRAQRDAAVRTLMERGDWDAVERLRTGGLHISDVHAAVREGDFARLAAPLVAGEQEAAPSAELPDLLLLEELDRLLTAVAATSSPRTHEQYQAMRTVILAHFGERQPMRTVTTTMAEAFLHSPKEHMGGRVWEPRTQNLYATLLGQVWAVTIEREAEAAEIEDRKPRLTRNPWRKKGAGGIRLPEIKPTRHAWLRPSQWRALSEITAGTSRRAMYGLGCLAGLRQQEVAHQRTNVDVDLSGRVIVVQPRKGDRAWIAKTNRSTREIPIGDELMEILREHIRLGYAGERYFLHPADGDRPWSRSAFPRFSREDFTAVGLRYGRAVGDALTFHSLRHTFASWLVQRDVQLMKVAELLGDSVEMVVKHYGHLMPSDRRRAIAILDEVARMPDQEET